MIDDPEPWEYMPGPPPCDGTGVIDYKCDHWRHGTPACECREIDCPGCANCKPSDIEQDTES